MTALQKYNTVTAMTALQKYILTFVVSGTGGELVSSSH